MNVLLAVDHSPCSDAALQHLLARDWPAGTNFHVLSIVEPFLPDYGEWFGTYTPTLYEAEQEHVRQTCAFVQSVAEKIGARFGPANVSAQCAEGFIKDEILRQARVWPADLIILGSHGRKGLAKWLLGSISSAVSAQAPCAVEVIAVPQARPSGQGQRKAG